MAQNYGPYANMPGSPFYTGQPEASRRGGTQQPPPNMVISHNVVVKSKFSANPGVLVSGRRQDRPGA